MALTRITKGVIKPNENYDTHDINSTGIITATGANITGNMTVGGVLTYEDVTSIDSVGIITARNGIDCNGDLDVDGHTNLDNVNIAGVTTTGGNLFVGGDIELPSSGKSLKIWTGGTQGIILNHGGSFGELDNQTGMMRIKAGRIKLSNRFGNLDMLTCNSFGSVDLFHNNILRFTTTGYGVSTTGLEVVGVSTFSDDVKFTVANGNGILLDKSENQFLINSGTYVRYQNNNEINADDGKIGTALFASGLNIVGSQTAGGLGRQIRLYGDLLTNAIKPTADSSYSIGTSSNRFLHTYLDNLDVDGHTNLDHVSIAGITTMSNKLNVAAGIQINASTSSLYATDGALSYYAANNGVYLNGAGVNGWLRLNASGGNNDKTSINLFGHTYGSSGSYADSITFRTNSTERLKIDKNGAITAGGNFSPNANNTYDLGGSSNVWKKIYGFDLDIDGHTNLDNVSIAGVTTFTGISHHSSSLQMLNGNNIVLQNDANSANCQIDCYGGAGFRLTSYNQTMFTCENGGNTKFYTNSGTTRLEITNGGDVLVNTGTLHIPDTLTHLGDTNTKIRFPSADTISFETGGAERLRITSAGHIGFNRSNVDINDTSSQQSVVEPSRFVFNNNYSNNYTDASLKLYLFMYGATRQGFTSGPEYDLQYHSSGHATHAKHSFFTQNTERLRITATGFIGINEDNPETGLTIAKLGDYSTNDGNTYYMPVGKWSSAWNGMNVIQDSTDYWVGFVGGYLKSSSSVNISLAPNRSNTNQQAGMYISGEATGNSSADFTLGKIVGGSATGQGTSGNVRATKNELLRIKPSGNLSLGNTHAAKKVHISTTGNQKILIDPNYNNNSGGSSNSEANANNIVESILIRTSFGDSAHNTTNAGHKWGIKFQGYNGNDFTQATAKCAGVFAVSEDEAGGYNRNVGLTFHTSPYNTAHREVMRINTNGIVTKPYQYVFTVTTTNHQKSANWSKITDHSIYSSQCTGVSDGTNWSNSTQRFTAPVAGVYHFFVGGWSYGNSNGSRYAYSFRHTNGNNLTFIGGGDYCSGDSPMVGWSRTIKLAKDEWVELWGYSAIAVRWGGGHVFFWGGYLLG